MAGAKKVCLAYSGGLDTSTILKWLLEQGYEVVCFLANVGQDEADWDQVRQKALKLGASKMVIKDLRREFITDLCFRAIQCNAQYEGRYLLGTSLARPVIARGQMQVALEENCEYVSHGATAKGNDCVRLEKCYLAISPTVKILAPWRMPEFFNRFQGRQDLLEYAEKTGIPVTSTKAAPWSMDDNAAHCSYEAGQLEDASQPPPSDMWTRTNDPMTAPDKPQDVTISFEKGIPTKVSSDGKEWTDPLDLFMALSDMGRINGIGRIDIVENRRIGIKGRGCYDAPAHTILRAAHLDLEGLVMDRRVRSIRDQFVTHTWSELLYDGDYFAPEQEFLENSIIFSQRRVNGEVKLRLYRGNTWVLGRWSATEKLYSEVESSMDSLTDFSPTDTTGFINIESIRLRKYGLQKLEEGQSLAKS